MTAQRFYAVAIGRLPGIYRNWYGDDGAEAQVAGHPNARFRGFLKLAEAQSWLNGELEMLKKSCLAQPKLEVQESFWPPAPVSLPPDAAKPPPTPPAQAAQAQGTQEQTGPARAAPADLPLPDSRSNSSKGAAHPPGTPLPKVTLYSDGSALRNPGPGGYGTVVLEGGKRREISEGFRRTTNNRMELMGCIEGLRSLQQRSSVDVYTDSQYLVNGIEKGWARHWRSRGWMRTEEEPARNADLWSTLLQLCTWHRVRFHWVRGHAGNKENERCDRLAVKAAETKGAGIDERFEKGETTLASRERTSERNAIQGGRDGTERRS